MTTDSQMILSCFGARGSLPAPSRPGFSTIKYGGNTSCYYVQAGPFRIILDDGSGISVLGDTLMKNGVIGVDFINLISHYHWDHIQGLPFCVPFFLLRNEFFLHGPTPSGQEQTGQPRSSVEMMLSHQQSHPHFPVAHESMPAHKNYEGHSRQFVQEVFYEIDGHRDGHYKKVYGFTSHVRPEHQLKITSVPVNHPDGCIGYRIDWMDISLFYGGDNEPFRFPNNHIVQQASNVNCLIMDGTYTDDQLSGMVQTFGHGSPESCLDQAIACQAKHLIISHHDLRHDDTKIGEMEQGIKRIADTLEFGSSHVEMAQEGKTWIIDQDGTTEFKA